MKENENLDDTSTEGLKYLFGKLFKLDKLFKCMKNEADMENIEISFDKEKFKQVLHYIVSRVGSLDNVGKTVLFKMLYFSDFDHYELYEKSITGETYVKLPLGPAPKNFNHAITELKKENKIKEVHIKIGRMKQIKFLSLSTSKIDKLNAEEIKVIDNVLLKLSGMSARQVSSYSHEDMPWKATGNQEDIDYEFVFYRNPIFSVVENS